MEIKIPDKDLKGFNNRALSKLEEAGNEFINDLIEEANRIELSRNSTGEEPEITSTIVHDANMFLRRGLSQPKKSVWIIIFRILASVLSLVVGVLYNPTALQNSIYMFVYILVITITILTVTITSIKE